MAEKLSNKNKKKQGRGRKIGRNKDWCKAYTMFELHKEHKLATISRHMRKFPKDQQAYNRYRSLTGVGHVKQES